MGTVARGAKSGGGQNFNAGQVIDPAEVNQDFNTLFTEVNGFLDDTNLETGTLPGAKSLRFTEISAPSTPASNDLLVWAKDDGAGVTRLYTTDAAGVGKVVTPEELLYFNPFEAGTGANTTPTPLQTYTLPAGILAVDYDTIRMKVSGTFAANANVKTVQLHCGSSPLLTLSGSYNNVIWGIDAEIYRIAATTQYYHAVGQLQGLPLAASQGGIAETLANALTLQLSGTNGVASANDILAQRFRVSLLPYQPRF